VSRRSVFISCEQAIYGSFPFWDQGYALLARSPGCRSESATEFSRLCQSLGQPPSDASPEIDRLLFAARLTSGDWVIALGSSQGCDDRGRPGAWAFHGLFLSHADYKKTGAWPFAFENCFKTQFHLNQILEKIQVEVENHADSANSLSKNQMIKPEWMKFIRRRNYLRIHQENTTIEEFRAIWQKIPGRERARNSMTTMLFRPSADFNIAAIKPAFKPVDQQNQTQKLISISFEELLHDKTVHLNKPDFKETIRKILFGRSIRKLSLLIGLFVICMVFLMRCNFNQESVTGLTTNQPNSLNEQPPDPALFQLTVEKPDLVHAIREHLTDWSDRLHLDPVDPVDSEMQISRRILATISYQGPFISEKIDDQLPNAARVKQMDTLIKKYTQFRKWPEDQAVVHSSRLALANLAWAVEENRLCDQARNLNSAADVRVWFAELRHRLFSQELLSLSQPSGAESQYPELIEYRLHFSRLSALVEK
jgi:hypothetical protein